MAMPIHRSSQRCTGSFFLKAATGMTSEKSQRTSVQRCKRQCGKSSAPTLTSLFRVFGSADWGNKEKFSDELLKDLIEGFSEIQLGNAAVSTDVLGNAYEYLVGKFADVTRRNKAGEFYTPRSVVRMMVELLDPKEGESIYDPACGTGGMLLGAIEHVTRKGARQRRAARRGRSRTRSGWSGNASSRRGCGSKTSTS